VFLSLKHELLVMTGQGFGNIINLSPGHPSQRRRPLPDGLVTEGKIVKNRLHLDLAATDWDAEIGGLTDLGPRAPLTARLKPASRKEEQ
jgi:hypothetical protein